MVHSNLPVDVEPAPVDVAPGGVPARHLTGLGSDDHSGASTEEHRLARFISSPTSKRPGGGGSVRPRDAGAAEVWRTSAEADTLTRADADELSFSAAAEILGVSKTTVRRWSTGSPPKLPSARQDASGNWRVRRSDVDAVLLTSSPPEAGPGTGADAVPAILAQLAQIQGQVDALRADLSTISEGMEEAHAVVAGVDRRLVALRDNPGRPTLAPEQSSSGQGFAGSGPTTSTHKEVSASTELQVARGASTDPEPEVGVPPFLEVERHRRAKAEELDRAAPQRRWWQRS